MGSRGSPREPAGAVILGVQRSLLCCLLSWIFSPIQRKYRSGFVPNCGRAPAASRLNRAWEER